MAKDTKEPKIVLKLNGKAFDLHQPTPVVFKIISFLDSSPKDELYTLPEIADKLHISKDSISKLVSREEAKPYSLLVRQRRYYGHPAAIAELLKQTGGAE